MKKEDIQIRDPFILPIAATQEYYLFGTTDKDCWKGPAEGFDCYRSSDLEDWEGPFGYFYSRHLTDSQIGRLALGSVLVSRRTISSRFSIT